MDENSSYFTQPHFVNNEDIFTPATLTGHGNEYYLSTGADGSSLTHLRSVADGLIAPAIITGHDNSSPLDLNTNGFDFSPLGFHPNAVLTPSGMNINGTGLAQPQFAVHNVFTRPISTFPATTNGQGLLGGGEFAKLDGDFNDFSPISNAHGFYHGNNPLPTLGAYSSNYDSGSLLTMSEYAYNYGTNPIPPGNNAYGSIFTTPPQVANGVITGSNPGLLTATPYIPPVDPAAAEPPATAPGSRQICPVCQKTFGRLSDLKRHAAKHCAGPRKFNCPATGCRYKGDKGFTKKDKMKDHVKNKHPGIDVRSL